MKKKVLVVTALAGFFRSFLTNDIKILQNMGYEVHCAANVLHPGSEGMNEYFKQNNIIFHQIDFSSNKPFSKQTFLAYKQLKNLINNDYFDVVHCHTPIVSVLGRWCCRKLRKEGMRVIYTTHGFYFHQGSSRKSWIIFHSIEKFMSRFCDAIITINCEDYENAKKMHCKNVFHINGVGVDTDRFANVNINREEYRKSIGIANNEIVVLSIGELSERKNQKVVIEAIGNLNNSNIVLVHCGNAMNSEATTKQLIDLAKRKNVKLILLGLRKDIPEICKCADIGTISSTREGLGLAGIEMLASGLPLVGSKVHGILDYVVNEVNGFLANPYDSNEFTEGIRKLLDKNTHEKLSAACYESVLKFDIKNSYAQMEEIYKYLLYN
ncbi:glycosyltransferase [Clostridium perfringens]|uniref:glycosyltransferase n=1 Tax=Clostridium perfringens TaxID=1502 RepID=UPI002A2E8E6B|nr:glycosyltransferase [Clostridium perfringens]MDK0779574.1 glycosyltransferase [Clostridium perfringens]